MGLQPEQLLVAEVKTRSPFDNQWRPAESWEERFEIAEEYGDWIAIHTNEAWGGSFRLLEKVRERTSKPILAKGFHQTDADITRALKVGAEYVLRVGSNLPPEEYLDRCLIEPLTLYSLEHLTAGVQRAVWNARNLTTGEAKVDSFEAARRVRPEGWLCQASNIRTVADVHPEADAILVGTHLPEFVKALG